MYEGGPLGPEGRGALVCPEAGLPAPQMHLLEGAVNVRGSLAHVPQQAWVFVGSIRDNILMGSQYDQAR